MILLYSNIRKTAFRCLRTFKNKVKSDKILKSLYFFQLYHPTNPWTLHAVLLYTLSIDCETYGLNILLFTHIPTQQPQ